MVKILDKISISCPMPYWVTARAPRVQSKHPCNSQRGRRPAAAPVNGFKHHSRFVGPCSTAKADWSPSNRSSTITCKAILLPSTLRGSPQVVRSIENSPEFARVKQGRTLSMAYCKDTQGNFLGCRKRTKFEQLPLWFAGSLCGRKPRHMVRLKRNIGTTRKIGAP